MLESGLLARRQMFSPVNENAQRDHYTQTTCYLR